MSKIVFIGSDHGGFEMKGKIKKYLETSKILFEDLGTYSNESTSYVVYAEAVCNKVIESDGRGILICSSGIGMSIAANKVIGIRAALCTSNFHAEFSRRHNDANIICFGSKVSGEISIIEMIDIFLNTPFDGGRHKIRVDMISEIERKNLGFSDLN